MTLVLLSSVFSITFEEFGKGGAVWEGGGAVWESHFNGAELNFFQGGPF